MLTAHKISYTHPDKELLFEYLSFSIQRNDKVALIGNNGVGKSTLLKVLASILKPSNGSIKYISKPYYIPQHFGQYDQYLVSQVLHIDYKLKALNQILGGNATLGNMELLQEDWTIQERCQEAFAFWGIEDLALQTKMAKLSGGQKTKVFLAGSMIHEPDIILLDEPTNHLDIQSRQMLYTFIKNSKKSMVVVSHDRQLLELLSPVFEMSKQGITAYGGNYSFYKSQKEIEAQALSRELEDKEKTLRINRKMERESIERKQRLDARGKKKKAKEGVPRVVMNKLKNQAESSTARLKDAHTAKIESVAAQLNEIRKRIPDVSRIRMNFENSELHKGKTLITVEGINFGYDDLMLWSEPLSAEIFSRDRINIIGINGSGKTTLIRLMLGKLEPTIGVIKRANFKYVYVDQDYSLINDTLSVYEQVQEYNYDALQEHEIKIRLNRYLFTKDFWDKKCNSLSGGEKMRLLLCCLMISNHAPDIFVLDEPTNNLDIQNIEILTKALIDYEGTLIVISHDSYFLKEINISKTLTLN